jgi:hypothetical protein
MVSDAIMRPMDGDDDAAHDLEDALRLEGRLDRCPCCGAFNASECQTPPHFPCNFVECENDV